MVGIKKLEKGFTLIELLTVIVILSLLILVALPNVLKVFLNARKDAFIIEAKEIYSQSKETYIKESLKGKKIGVIDSEGNNKLNLDNAKDLGYCLILDNNGNVQDMIVYNNMFYVSVDNPIVEIEGLSRDDIKEEIPEDFLCDDLDPNKRYSVSFDSNGGEEPSFLKNNDLINGEQYGNLPITMWEEHNFIGWFTDKIIGNQIVETSIFNRKDKIDTLYAHWIQIKYNVTLDANGGNLPTTTFSIAKNEPYGALPVPTLSNYTFAGWFTEKNAGIEIKSNTLYNLSTDQTLYAHWTINKYVVKFDSNGGNTPNIESINVTYGTNYGTLATVTRTNYKFMGWFTDSTNGTQITSTTLVKINSNQTLYAHWQLDVDVNAPIITINAIPTAYSLNNQIITGTITDQQEGIVSGNISYALTTSQTAPTSGWKNTTSITINFNDLSATTNTTYYVHAKDGAGNKSYKAVSISNIAVSKNKTYSANNLLNSYISKQENIDSAVKLISVIATYGTTNINNFSLTSNGTLLSYSGQASTYQYTNGTTQHYESASSYYAGSSYCSNYYCPYGGNLSGTNCFDRTEISSTDTNSWLCNNGRMTNTGSAGQTTPCPYGYSRESGWSTDGRCNYVYDGASCSSAGSCIFTAYGYCSKTYSATCSNIVTPTCNYGEYQSGNYCYYCNSGTISGTQCLVSSPNIVTRYRYSYQVTYWVKK